MHMKKIIFAICFLLVLFIPSETYAYTRNVMGARSIRATIGNNGITVLNTTQLSAGGVSVGNTATNTQIYQYNIIKQHIELLKQKLQDFYQK